MNSNQLLCLSCYLFQSFHVQYNFFVTCRMGRYYFYVWCMALVIGVSGDEDCTTTTKNCYCRDGMFQCSGLTEFPDPPIGMHPLRLSFTGCTFNEITAVDMPMMYHRAETLIIHNSHITKIHDRVFYLFSDLKKLSLESNNITQITKATLRGLDGLEMLNLNGNRLTTLQTDVLSSTPALKELQLGNNENLELPDALFDGINLTTLRLSFCGYQTVPHYLFDKASHLQYLYLSGNPLHSLSDNSFSMLPELRLLSLSDCGLGSLPDGVFAGLNKLEELVLSSNNLTSLNPTATAPFKDSIRVILLDNNQLQTLSGDLVNWNNLEDIKLGHNQWHCDCHLHWIHTIDLEHLDEENIR